MTHFCQIKNRNYYKMEFCTKALHAARWWMCSCHPKVVLTVELKDLCALKSSHPKGSIIQQAPNVSITGLSAWVCWCHWGYLQGTSQHICFVELVFQLSRVVCCPASPAALLFKSVALWTQKHQVKSIYTLILKLSPKCVFKSNNRLLYRGNAEQTHEETSTRTCISLLAARSLSVTSCSISWYFFS